MRVGVLGGTFDPPHLAHLTLGAAAKHALGLDRVIFVPAGDPWRKAAQAITPSEIRARMLRAAVAPLAWAEVSLVEVDRPGPSYMSETLLLLAAERAEADWWFILGDDALADMPHWYQPEQLLKLARLALVWRPPGAGTVPGEVRARLPGIEARLDIVPMTPLAVSATAIRQRIRDGRATTILLPEGVRAIVDELGLYRGPD